MLAVVVLVLVFLFARLLTAPRVFTPVQGPAVTPQPAERTPEPLSGPPPNVVLIVTDDQRWDTLSVMPNIQRLLIGRGLAFNNAFASTPVCCPSRATILTGQQAYHTGVTDNEGPRGGVRSFKHRTSLATWLKESGYSTSYIGKYLEGYERYGEYSFVPPGWDDWHAILGLPEGGEAFFNYGMNENGKFVRYGEARSDYQTDVLARRAVEFIGRAQRPFFVHLAPFAPHPPAHPAPGDEGAFAQEPAFRPPSYDVRAREDTPAAKLPPIPPKYAGIYDAYRRNALGSLLAVDRAVGDIVEAVASKGELENTIFIYMSDNGFLLGEHRLFGKVWPYEPSIRIPLVIRLPGAEQARTSEQLVLNADIAPTIVELTGARARLRPDGTSLVPLLRGDEEGWRQEVPLLYIGEGQVKAYDPPRWLGIRTHRYKFVIYDDNSRELFDLKEDPDELENLSGSASIYEVENQLYQQLGKLTPQGHLGRRSLPRPTPDPNAEPRELFED